MTDHPKEAVVVRQDNDRFESPFDFIDANFCIVVSSRDTDGRMAAIDTNRRLPGGPPMHVHPDQEEWFFVREGEFDISVGGVVHHLTAGDSLVAPRGVPHAFANTTPTGRMLVTFVPAGDMEAFFWEASKLEAPTPPVMAEIFARHGMRVVGPPLAVTPSG